MKLTRVTDSESLQPKSGWSGALNPMWHGASFLAQPAWGWVWPLWGLP